MIEVCVKDDMIDFYALEHNNREDLIAYGFKIFEIEDEYFGLCEARDFDENGLNIQLYNARRQKNLNHFRIDELKQKLYNTDYVANKLSEEIATSFVTGDNSSVIALRNKYFNILADRGAWREEINRLEEELKNGN